MALRLVWRLSCIGSSRTPKTQPLAPLEAEFVKLMMSKAGQEIVVKDGYIPLPAAVAEKQLAAAGIKLDTVAKN